jgi:hypothetical protein
MTVEILTYIIYIGVDAFGIKTFFPFLFSLLNMLANPDIAVETKDKVNATRQCNEVGLETSNQNGRYCDKLSISQLK